MSTRETAIEALVAMGMSRRDAVRRVDMEEVAAEKASASGDDDMMKRLDMMLAQLDALGKRIDKLEGGAEKKDEAGGEGDSEGEGNESLTKADAIAYADRRMNLLDAARRFQIEKLDALGNAEIEAAIVEKLVPDAPKKRADGYDAAIVDAYIATSRSDSEGSRSGASNPWSVIALPGTGTARRDADDKHSLDALDALNALKK